MDEIYDTYFYRIYNWSLKKTKNIQDAEDLTNSIFLALFQYVGKNAKIEKAEHLIWTIAYNLWCTKAKEYIKEKQNILFDEDYQKSYNEEFLDKIIYKDIIRNIKNVGLTTKEYISFRLYYIFDFSIKKIAEKLGTNENNVKYYLYNSRKKIKERYYE